MTLDDEAELINYARYGQDTGFHCVNTLRRHTEGNILFAGCFGRIAVVLWAGDQFHLIHVIQNVVNKPLTDLSFFKNALYGVSDHNRGLACYFDDRYVRGRDPRGPEKAHGMYRNLPKTGSSNTLADEYRMRARIDPKYGHLFRDYNIQQIELPGGKA
jgi:hypothetical protein